MSATLGRRLFFMGFVMARAILLSLSSVFVFSQSFAQTPEQLQQLNSIPANQRQAFMQQLGLDGQQQGQVDAQLNFPDVVTPLAEMDDIGEAQDLVPRLAPGDTLVIEFVLRPLNWIPISTPTQFLSPTQAVAATAGATTVAGQIIASSLEDVAENENQYQYQYQYDEELEAEENRAMLERLAAANPYELDVNGFLNLPGVASIRLQGLNVEEAMIRIRAEPALVWLQPIVTFLPLEPFGVESLEPFGYDLFSGVPTTFAPATDVPVPSEYVMGPGDTVNVLLFGNNNAQYQLVISREGAINFPEIGPISVAGLSFEELTTVITQRVEEQMIGVRSSITLGELRSIRVFVLGDVQQPGSYTVSGLSTMTNALFVSGGINDVGSLRQIELRREGQIVSTLDLYDLLLRGDTSGDERLQPGDVIFAPPIGDSISIYGDIRRPAIYEINGENSVEEVVELAGGFRSNADRSALRLERLMPGGVRAYDINLAIPTDGIQSLQDGDVLIVPSRVEQLDNAVRLSGNVFQSGLYPWDEGFTLTDLISSRELVKPGSDLRYVLVRREIQPNVLTEVFSIDLQAAWENPKGPQDPILQSRDTVYVFDRLNSRQPIILELLEEQRQQRFRGENIPVVRVGGQVASPGEYPLELGMTIADLVRAGGGLTEAAYNLEAELIRYNNINGRSMQTEIIRVNLQDSLQDVGMANLILSSYDYLNIKVVPNWNAQQVVELVGEVNFPGLYPLLEGETLKDVLERAGGFTDRAFPDGVLFIREELVQREADQLENMANRLEGDLQSLSTDPQSAQAAAAGLALVSRLRNTEPVGRLVINMDDILSDEYGQSIVLRNNDRLYVPPISQEVTVLGEVQYPTSHLYQEGLARDAYISMSGGTTENSDESRIYIVHANGGVDIDNGSRWFVGQNHSEIMPGDTVVVPIDTSMPLIPMWASATQVIYNIAIAAAALQSF